MDIVFVSLGSKGNASLIRVGDTIIQIDMGVTLKAVKAGLKHLGASLSDIKALFITHEHSDHIKGLELYHGRVPVYAGEGTLAGLDEEHILHEGEAVDIGDLCVLPFRSSHDAFNPMNFIILGDDKKFGYVTDTGVIRATGLKLLKGSDYLLMESNYGTHELLTGPYPAFLKKRIHGKKGHLSNEDSASYCASLIGEKTKQIFLGHISLENNTPELAYNTYHDILTEKGVLRDNISLIAIPQLTLQLGGDLL